MIWSRPEYRVLFVCTANVCRSPLAEAMLRHRLRAIGLGRRVQVRSAGTRVGQPGRKPDPRLQRLAEEGGFALGRIRARQVTGPMIVGSDLVLVMEPEHRDELRALMLPDRLPEGVLLLGDFLPHASLDTTIPDPYYGDLQGFLEVFDRVDRALEELIHYIQRRFLPPL